MRKYVRWLALAAGALAFGLAGWLLALCLPEGGRERGQRGRDPQPRSPCCSPTGLAGRHGGGRGREGTCPTPATTG